MRTQIGFLVAAAVILSIMSASALGGGTSVAYIYSRSFSLRIPEDPAATKGWMQDAVVTVPDHVLICDVDVFMSLRHTAAFDLQLFLQGPSETVVVLALNDPFTGYYEGQDYIATTFDDEADVGIAEGSPPFAGSFRPFESLTAFDGLDACGDWSLRVYDAYYNDIGCFEFFAVIVTAFSTEFPERVPAPSAGGLTLLGLALISRSLARPRNPRPRSAQDNAASFCRTFSSCSLLN